MTTIDYQQAAIQAGAKALAEHQIGEDWGDDGVTFIGCDCGQWFGKRVNGGKELARTHEAQSAITAATPHLRAAWEQPIRELHRPVHAVFNWADGPRYEEPCETCHGAPGVHECGCWADTQLEYVCAECHRLGGGSIGVYDYTYPCPTIQALDEKGTRL